MEEVLQAKKEFEQKMAIEQAKAKKFETDDELEELCQLAAELPALWHHPLVTHQERKELLRCVIDHIVVSATKERIDATIFWKTGEQTPMVLWRGTGRYVLIRELHAHGLTVFEIKEHLAAGETSNGQKMNITVGRLYDVLRELGLKPNRFSADHLALRQRAWELHLSGQSTDSIADHFNEQRFKSASGAPWTQSMVHGLLRAQGKTAIVMKFAARRSAAYTVMTAGPAND